MANPINQTHKTPTLQLTDFFNQGATGSLLPVLGWRMNETNQRTNARTTPNPDPTPPNRALSSPLYPGGGIQGG